MRGAYIFLESVLNTKCSRILDNQMTMSVKDNDKTLPSNVSFITFC